MDKTLDTHSTTEDKQDLFSTSFAFEFDAHTKILCESFQASQEVSIASEYTGKIEELIRDSNSDAIEQPDLSIILCYGGVSNVFNGNRDGIDTATAKAIIGDFIHKPVNVQHKKKDIVGHIIEAGFVDKENSDNLIKIGSKEFDEIDDNSSYYLAFVLVLYRAVFPEFEKLLENQSIKMSWELGFSKVSLRSSKDYQPKEELLIQNTEEVASNAVDGYDVERFNKIRSHLIQVKDKKGKSADGKNPETGFPLFRQILLPVVPLALAFVEKPAANVPEIRFFNAVEKDEKSQDKKSHFSNHSKDSGVEQSIVSNKSNTFNKKQMEQEIITQLSAMLDAKLASLTEISQASFSEESVASLREMLVEATKNANTIYLGEKNKLENSVAEQAKLAESFKKSNEETKAKLEDAMKELHAMRQSLAERESIEHMNYAMESLDSECSMSEDQKNVVMEDLKAMCQNGYNAKESVAAYLVKMKKLLPKKAMEKSSAAINDDDALDAAKQEANAEKIFAKGGDTTESLVEKARRLFTVKVVK